MEDVTSFFQEVHETFTIYVVEQHFVIGRGREYFNSFIGKENYLSTNTHVQKRIHKILDYIAKKVPPVAELIEMCFMSNKSVGLKDAINALIKLFSVHEHQAAGPEVIDPILIQEGQILPILLSQLISLHRRSILQPRIIILLKDNNFDRAKKLLSDCPSGINVKMIRNSGECEIYKVINKGTNSVDKFIEAYARQCFSTCSNTPRDVLLNNEWDENSLIKTYSPAIFRIRTKLINDEKFVVRDDIDAVLKMIEMEQLSGENQKLLNSFHCMIRLFKVFCYDYGGNDLKIAQKIADELDNELLLAHVYRFSHFFTNSRKEKQELLMQAYKIFSKNSIEDHAIYCMNNSLIHQFSMDNISIRDFRKMQEMAVSNVPGLVGMSHIFNNIGVAHLLTANPEEAIDCFTKGLDYAKDRPVQKMVLLSNRLMAKAYASEPISDTEIEQTVSRLFDSLGRSSLSFNVSHFAMNILSVAFMKNAALAKELQYKYPFQNLVQRGLDTNIMGSGSIIRQMESLASKYPDFSMLNSLRLPNERTSISGIRLDYIERYGFNPFFHNIWL